LDGGARVARHPCPAQMAACTADVYGLHGLLWERGLKASARPDAQFVTVGSAVSRATAHYAAGRWSQPAPGRHPGNIYLNGADFDFLAFINKAMQDMQAGDQTPLHKRPDYVPGYIALITPDGSSRQVAGDIAFPNGMVVTPDNQTLIISESFTGTLTAFDIAEDGGLSNRRVFADGLGPDGICMDADGAVWTSPGEGQACVRVREGGEIVNRVELDRSSFACMLGGPQGRTLFIMAAEWNPENPFGGRTGQVLTVDVPASHVGWP
jgi:hypothetical protein